MIITILTILAIGKLKDKSLQTLQNEYIKRLQPFAKTDITEIKDDPETHPDRAAECGLIKDREAQRALEKIRGGDFVVLLDLHGKMWSSEEFAGHLQEWTQASQRLVFVIAGSLGPGKALESTDRACECALEAFGSDVHASDDARHSAGADLPGLHDRRGPLVS